MNLDENWWGLVPSVINAYATSAIHQCSVAKPGIVLAAVDGSLESWRPEADIPVHSNTSGEQEYVSAFFFLDINQRLIIIFRQCTNTIKLLFSKRHLKRFIRLFLLQEKEGWAAERSRSETNVLAQRAQCTAPLTSPRFFL